MTSRAVDRQAYELILRMNRATLQQFFNQFFDLVQRAYGPALAPVEGPRSHRIEAEGLAGVTLQELCEHPAVKRFGRLKRWGWRIDHHATPPEYEPGRPIILRRGRRLKTLFVEASG